MKIQFFLSYIIIVTIFFSSCSKDFLEPTVTTQRDAATSINTVDDLKGLILGAYDRMNAAAYYGRDFVVYGEVRSDNAYSSGNTGRFVAQGQFTLTANNANASDTWVQIYRVIANANLAATSTVANNESKEVKYVKGQAHAIRAIAYMDLLRLYGQEYAGGNLGVPLVIKFRSDELYPARATVTEVWNQVGKDLETAIELMDPTLNKTTPIEVNSWLVYALQSRYYLYVKDYPKAAAAAKKVIDSGKYSMTTNANHVASWSAVTNANTIFQLAFTPTDNLGFNSLFFIYQQTTYGDIEVTENLYSLYELSDIRRSLFTKTTLRTRMTGKYSKVDYTDHIKIMRYDEVLLNYAEALAQLNSSEALTVLNMIPAGRGATLYTSASLANVYLERRKELAMEGHRFFDLMRWGVGVPKVDPKQSFPASIAMGAPVLTFPIPQSELNANPSIVQNVGY
jgi:starch-binding outer membrane protein, SusD/RagB family